MSTDTVVVLLVVVGLGAAAFWFLSQQKQTEQKPPCGVPIAAYGVGATVPCDAIKDALTGLRDVGNKLPVVGDVLSLTGLDGMEHLNDCPYWPKSGAGWRGAEVSNLTMEQKSQRYQMCKDWIAAGKPKVELIKPLDKAAPIRGTLIKPDASGKYTAAQTASFRGTATNGTTTRKV